MQSPYLQINEDLLLLTNIANVYYLKLLIELA